MKQFDGFTATGSSSPLRVLSSHMPPVLKGRHIPVVGFNPPLGWLAGIKWDACYFKINTPLDPQPSPPQILNLLPHLVLPRRDLPDHFRFDKGLQAGLQALLRQHLTEFLFVGTPYGDREDKFNV